MLRHFDAGLGQSANRTKRRQIVESKQRRKFSPPLQQLFRQTKAAFKSRIGVEFFRKLHRQALVDFESHRVCKLLDPFPARPGIDQRFWPANEGDLPVTEFVQMLERQPPAPFVVHHHGTHGVAGKLPANCCGRNIAFRKIRQQVNVNEEPVGNHDQCFDVTVENHFQITLEPVPLIMRVRKNRYVRGLIQRVLNSA